MIIYNYYMWLDYEALLLWRKDHSRSATGYQQCLFEDYDALNHATRHEKYIMTGGRITRA